MRIEIILTIDTVSMTPDFVGLATGAQTRTALQPEFERTLASHRTRRNASLRVHESTLRRMIDQCAEQFVVRPLDDVKDWFAYYGGGFFNHGYSRLYYPRTGRRKPGANKTAVSAVGEGVAGLVAQRIHRAWQLARPFHDYPDLVLQNAKGILLAEAKATTTELPSSLVCKELPRFASYVSSARQLDPDVWLGLLIATKITREDRYETHVVEVSS